MENLIQNIFHLLCVKDDVKPESYIEDYFEESFNETEDLFYHFGNKVNLKQKKVLDIGCGYGSSCIYMALHGAAKVVGIDIDEDRINYAKSKLGNDYPNLSSFVDFRQAGSIIDEKFDIVISKDSFMHYADPENFVTNIKQYLNQDSIIVIVFGPLWKAPYGGQIAYMTKVPWAHLLFPESVIMRERKRFRPNEDATSFEQVKGSLNKMTFRRYMNIIKENGLEVEYFKTNLTRRNSRAKFTTLFNFLRKIPFCQEFFTQNVYSIIRLRTLTR